MLIFDKNPSQATLLGGQARVRLELIISFSLFIILIFILTSAIRISQVLARILWRQKGKMRESQLYDENKSKLYDGE